MHVKMLHHDNLHNLMKCYLKNNKHAREGTNKQTLHNEGLS